MWLVPDSWGSPTVEVNHCHGPGRGHPCMGTPSAPRRPGINPDGTVTVLHGTTRLNAEAILQGGFKPGDPAGVASMVEQEYGLQPGAVLNHIAFEFAKGRHDLDRIHFATNPQLAMEYTTPEVLQDALQAVWSIQHPTETVTKEWSEARKAWKDRESARLAEPVILAVTVPWDVVGQNAFGRPIPLSEFKGMGIPFEELHSFSLPISALGVAKIVPALHQRLRLRRTREVNRCHGPGRGHPCVGGAVVAKVRKVLTPDLLKPAWRAKCRSGDATSKGHCYAAAEAVYHLMGGQASGLIPMRGRDTTGGTHWWLRDRSGAIVDPTADQYTARGKTPPYAKGRGGGFLTRQPSARAREIIRRVRRER